MRPAPQQLSHLSHPRAFLAGVGEVGIESLSPDSFPDLLGCYPVISQISFQKPSLATGPCHPRRQKGQKRKADHLLTSSPSEDPQKQRRRSSWLYVPPQEVTLVIK